MNGLLHAALVGALTDRLGQKILLAVTDHRPSVVGTGHQPIKLITPAGAVFMHPDSTCYWILRQSLWIAIPVGVYLGLICAMPDKRIIRRDSAISHETHHGSRVCGAILCLRARSPVSQGGVKIAIRKKQTAAEMSAGFVLRQCPEDHLKLVQAVVAKDPTANLGTAASLSLGYVGETEPAVLVESRIQSDIQKTALIPLG